MNQKDIDYILGIKRPEIPKSSRPWADFTLMLVTPEEFLKLPNGTIVIDIWGTPVLKHDGIDTDTRYGCTAYGFLKEKQEEISK